MRGILITSVAALFMSATAVNAQENAVYVNLSVLNALDAEPAVEPAAPLFPIVKAQPRQKAAPQKIRKAAKKSPAKVNIKIVKPEPKPSQPVVAKPNRPTPIPYVESREDVEVVDVEPVAADKTGAVVSQTPQPAADIKETSAEKTVSSNPPAAEHNAPAPQPLLVEPEAALPPAVNAKLTFAENETTLNDAQKAQIDAVINSFSDAVGNKIAIYSYNLDDGVDSFRKKRQSLNRAVEVRGYLLQKGYKNFSIKVLNVDGSSDKINSVELEELK